jgi:hypothetical protein
LPIAGQILALALDLLLLLRNLGIALLQPISDQGTGSRPKSGSNRRSDTRTPNRSANQGSGRAAQQRSDSGSLLTRREGL